MIDITQYGFDQAQAPQNTGAIPARVTAVHRDRFALVCENGTVFGKLKPGAYYAGSADGAAQAVPVVGDFVLIEYNHGGESRIVKTLARKSIFVRNDFSGHKAGYAKTVLEQVVAANFDYVFIMQSQNHDFNSRRLERYLALAWQSGAVPVVLLTKADLVQDKALGLRLAEDTAMGVAVHAVSAKTGYGLEALQAYLQPRKTVVFLGSSGVGKSSLVNALAGEELMAVKEIREDDSRGRHMTTHRQLFLLKSGAMIIDTPGMRELGMWDASEGLGEAFSDVEQYFGHCRFTDCAHAQEPGCAVRAAIECGELPAARWESYLQLKNEAQYAEERSPYLQKKQEWQKNIAKTNRHIEKQNKQYGGKRG